jgi:hypothetical protein
VAYRVVKDLDAGHRSRWLAVVSDVATRDEAQAVLQEIVSAKLADNAKIYIYLFLDADDVKTHGYIARAIARKDAALEVRFDNDPELRRALYENYHGD